VGHVTRYSGTRGEWEEKEGGDSLCCGEDPNSGGGHTTNGRFRGKKGREHGGVCENTVLAFEKKGNSYQEFHGSQHAGVLERAGKENGISWTMQWSAWFRGASNAGVVEAKGKNKAGESAELMRKGISQACGIGFLNLQSQKKKSGGRVSGCKRGWLMSNKKNPPGDPKNRLGLLKEPVDRRLKERERRKREKTSPCQRRKRGLHG